jgi:hypothetical protein
MASDAKRRFQKRSRRSEHSYLGIPHYIVRSPEFRRLEPWSVKLLIELASAYNGKNNGDLSAAYSVLCDRGWNSPGTLNAALKRLLTAGWITYTRHGGRNRCALYAVTWWPIDYCEGKHLEVRAETAPRHSWKTETVVGSRINVVGSRTNEPLDEAP